MIKIKRTLLSLALLILSLLTSRAGDSTEPKEFTAADRSHWAFQKISSPYPPSVKNEAWVLNPIDAFVLATLESKNMTPSAKADRATLLRRASLDLTGLPPTLQELDAYLADTSAEPWKKVMDRLLASPHYGERWARHWLDLARYAESEGFKADETRPNAWRYRDYVIKSLNDDKPYDRFVQEQIAGDELWPDDPAASVATGFNRHYADESNARNLMQRRQEILNDVTDTVGAVFVGMTYACARCHDHKFDPILQRDYYRLQAFFANTTADDNAVLASAATQREYREKLALWEEKTSWIREEMRALEEPKREAIIRDYVDKYPPEIQAALAKTEEQRSPFECLMVAKAKLYVDPRSHQYIGDTEAVVAKLKGSEKKRWEELRDELKTFAPLHPGELPRAAVMTDLSREAPATHLLSRGFYDAPREETPPGFLSMLSPQATPVLPLAKINSTGRRAALAKLLTDPANPLPARVIVNRVWHYHFGRGLVGTASDFGLKGDRPSHPELLDWLTTEFVRSGWSLKKLHRLIMSSSTYQQATDFQAEASQADPANRWLWRFPRHRLEGETIRDAGLAVAGLLNPKMGGPSIFPELPAGMTSRGGWKVNASADERNRRSVYVFVRRNTRYPMFMAFDMPDTHESCARRNVTTSPLQALTLLNSEVTLNWAQHFAARVRSLAGSDRHAQINAAYRLAFGRTAQTDEIATVEEFFRTQQGLLDQRIAAGETLALPPSLPQDADRAAAAALVDFCHMLMNSNEFVYLN